MVESERDSMTNWVSQGSLVPRPVLREQAHSLSQSRVSSNSYRFFGLKALKFDDFT